MTIDQKVDQLSLKVGGRKYPLNLQFFAESDPPAPPTPPDPPSGQTPPDPTPPTPPAEGGEPSAPEETFTQEQVNAIMSKESKKAQESTLKQLGFPDVEAAKNAMKQYNEWQDSQKTEAEKQASALKKLEDEKAVLLDKTSTLEAESAAMRAGVAGDSVKDVVTLAKGLISETVDMDAAIKQVTDKYPHFKSGQSTDGDKTPKFTKDKFNRLPSGGPSTFGDILLGKKK